MSTQAVKLIQRCLETQDLSLDLGNCGLSDKDFSPGNTLDNELRKCTHLETLILSNEWWDLDNVWVEKQSANKGRKNKLANAPAALAHLSGLKVLICAGKYKNKWGLNDMSFVSELTKLTHLDLSYNELREIKGVENLSSLIHLCLRDNHIKDLKALRPLTTIKKLEIWDNEITELVDLEDITGLQHLYMSDNKVISLKGLENLTLLQQLDLNSNDISDLSGLDRLIQLDELYLAKNRISELNGLDNQRSLTILDLSENQIDEIKGLDNLVSLKDLKIYSNQIQEIKGLDQLTALRKMDLGSNQIKEIKGLDTLNKLQVLELNYNQIQKVNGLDKLVSLHRLDLTGNKIDDLSHLLNRNLETVILDDTPILKTIPPEVVEAGWNAVRDRLLSQYQQENFVDFREVKVLLLGNTNVGKSNLLEYFQTNKEPIGDSSTHGIQYYVHGNLVAGSLLHIWDFGGQEYFHATHQLFFSPGALNIVLWSPKDVQREGEKEIFFDLNYWLRCIEQLASRGLTKKTEVLVVENKIDFNEYKASNINELIYTKEFENLTIHFTSINLKPLKRLISLKELIADRSEQLYIKHSETYYGYLQKIKNTDKSTLAIADFNADDPEKVRTAMKVFHNMGFLLYFHDKIPEKVFIKPQALLDLLYQKILGEEKKPEITMSEIERSISGNTLGLTIDEIISLLRHFDLVFQLKEYPDLYFVPQYLSAEPHFVSLFAKYFLPKANIRIKSDFYLMNIVMLKVFSEYGKHVKGKDTKEYHFWKDGLIVEKDDMLLMVKFDRKKQRIELFPDQYNNNFPLQKELVNFILNKEQAPHEINWSSKHFKVSVSVDGASFADWDSLNEKSNPRFHIYLPKNTRMKRLFISYSHKDEYWKDELIKNLAPLRNQDLIAHWHDRQLNDGLLDPQIEEAMENADIFLLLITHNFLSSAYITSREITTAYARFKLGKCRILPVICDPCNWQLQPITREEKEMHPTLHKEMYVWLGKFLAFPKDGKPISKWPNQQDGFVDVINQLERLL